MPPALTPALAVDYVHELSADVDAVVVLGADGQLEAGPEPLAADARALLAADGAAELEVVTPGGVVCAVRSPGHAAVAVCGRFAIPGVVREDLRAALAALHGRAPGDAGDAAGDAPRAAPAAVAPAAGEPANDALRTSAARLISALQRRSDA